METHPGSGLPLSMFNKALLIRVIPVGGIETMTFLSVGSGGVMVIRVRNIQKLCPQASQATRPTTNNRGPANPPLMIQRCSV